MSELKRSLLEYIFNELEKKALWTEEILSNTWLT